MKAKVSIHKTNEFEQNQKIISSILRKYVFSKLMLKCTPH